MSAQRRIYLLALMVLLVVALAPSAGEARERRVRGPVLAVFDDGSFQLEDGLVVRLAPQASAPPSLLVGQIVEASGEMVEDKELRARSVELRPLPGGEVRGQAILQEARDSPRGVLLLADGRRLLATERTRASSQEFVAGSYISYRGVWTENGEIELAEVSLSTNRLEEKEKAIYDEYRPEIQFSTRRPEQPAALRVGVNRYVVVDSPQVQLYFDQLGSRLAPALWRDAQAAERFGFSLWFVLVEHETPQATAFPSGVIVVHSGLLQLAENEAQLAFVVAHELAHVLEEHAWREAAYHRKKLQALRWSTAGIGFVVESAIRRGYQRELESQADRMALWYLQQAGFDPREGIRMLRLLESRQGGLSSLLWEKHRTFPQRRRAAMEELFRYSAQGLAYSSLTRDSNEFMTARARVPTSGVKEAAHEPDRRRR